MPDKRSLASSSGTSRSSSRSRGRPRGSCCSRAGDTAESLEDLAAWPSDSEAPEPGGSPERDSSGKESPRAVRLVPRAASQQQTLPTAGQCKNNTEAADTKNMQSDQNEAVKETHAIRTGPKTMSLPDGLVKWDAKAMGLYRCCPRQCQGGWAWATRARAQCQKCGSAMDPTLWQDYITDSGDTAHRMVVVETVQDTLLGAAHRPATSSKHSAAMTMTNKANKENKRKKKKEKRLPARAAPKARQDKRCVGKELDAPNTRRSSSSGLRPFSRLCSRDRDSNRGPATEPAPTSHGRAARSELMPAPEQGQASHYVVAKSEETTQKAVELAAIQLASVMVTGRSRAERRAAGKALQCLTMMRNDEEHLETAVPRSQPHPQVSPHHKRRVEKHRQERSSSTSPRRLRRRFSKSSQWMSSRPSQRAPAMGRVHI